MDEPESAATPPDGHISFSLRQIIAATTAIGAGFALCYALLSPPAGSSGLSWALLPALVLGVALWFCRNDAAARLGTYAVVASLFALFFIAVYMSQSDWLFGHTHGPPQLVHATCWSSTVGLVAGVMWILNKLGARQNAPGTGSAPSGEKPAAAGWFGAVLIIPVTLLSGLLAFSSLASIPQANNRMNEYIKQRQSRAEWAAASRAHAREFPPETPEEEAKKVALYRGLHSKDEAARYQASHGILTYSKITDSQTRLNAIEAISISPHRHEGEIEQLISDGVITKAEAAAALGQAIRSAPDDECRKDLIHSLGRLGPAASVAASELAQLLSKPEGVNVRTDTVKALSAIHPSGKDKFYTVLYFRDAWKKDLLAVEQAQVLYEIDPHVAEELQIPRPQPGP